MTRYLVLDVFTDQPFGGNQLAVIPDATRLPEPALQRIAREFNFSETTFVYPPDDPAHTAKIRIFTPTTEVPFAGHPTIGTAVALAQAGHGPDMVLELGVGPLHAHATPQQARFTTAVPLQQIGTPDIALVARALGLSTADVKTDTHPPVLATLGLPFTLTEVTDRAALSRISTDISAFRDGAALFPAGLDFAQMAYVRQGNTIHARMFAPLDNIPEDPATGSAAATLAALLARIENRDLSLVLHQGDDMGRPSRITLQTNGTAVTVSGQAVVTMEGNLRV